MEGVAGTLYEGEQFQLQFKFSNKYPFDSPEVGGNICQIKRQREVFVCYCFSGHFYREQHSSASTRL